MFGWDPILHLNSLLQPQIYYLGNDENKVSLETLKNIYEEVATNLKKARERLDHTLPMSPPTLKRLY